MRAARDQLEKLLSARSELLDKAQGQLASCTQDYLTSHAKDLDKIRGLWTAIAQRREVLRVCQDICYWHQYHLPGSQCVPCFIDAN